MSRKHLMSEPVKNIVNGIALTELITIDTTSQQGAREAYRLFKYDCNNVSKVMYNPDSWGSLVLNNEGMVTVFITEDNHADIMEDLDSAVLVVKAANPERDGQGNCYISATVNGEAKQFDDVFALSEFLANNISA